MKYENSINGVLLVDKGQDMTSHDVVAVARGCLRTKKIGHCGTLDPMATGLLILVIGTATKMQDLLMSDEKEYHATLKLGESTNSQDADGEIIAKRSIDHLSESSIQAAFQKFTGDFYQIPPMVSAVKINGVPLYKLARKGQEIERAPRLVHVFAHDIKKISIPEVDFRIVCSKGFYVRTYAHDIGELLNCGAHLTALRRTRSGQLDLEKLPHVTFEDLKNGKYEEAMAKIIPTEKLINSTTH
jgi:tRNA pseudouridine55 synthase